MRELPQVAFQGQSTEILLRPLPPPAPPAASGAGGQAEAALRRAEALTPGASLASNSPILSLFPHSVGKWDANLPNHQNSNIAQFNSFSILVALKKKIKIKQSKITRILGGRRMTCLAEIQSWF